MAINDKACLKCGRKGHFIKDCPLSQQDSMEQKSKYTDHRMDSHGNSTADMVMKPLTKLFADYVDQLKLLTPSGHSTHNGPPNCEGNSRHGHKQMVSNSGHRQDCKGNYHRQDYAQKNHSIRHCHRTSCKWNGGHHRDIKDGVGNKNK